VAVVSAFSRELSPLITAAEIQHTKFINGRTHYLGRLAGSDVVLVLVGVGLPTSGAATQALIDSFDITAILFAGIAGGINPDLNIGDVTIPARWRQADIPADAHEGWIDADPAMLAAARAVAEAVALDSCTTSGVCLGYSPEIVADGNGISNPFFVDDSTYRNWLWDTFQADVVDMETSAVAEVAHTNQLPFLAVRCISDLAGGAGSNQINTYLELAADNAAAVAASVLGAWSQSLNSVDISYLSPESYPVLSCFPNPFNPVTTICYDLPRNSEVTLTIHDLLGRELAKLAEGYREPGYHEAQWNGRDFASGLYIARLMTPEWGKSIRMVLLK
jgi:adenosylhomocysteine nucleosidase